MHGLAIYNIPKILKDFNITTTDIANDKKVIDILSDEMIDFFVNTFNLNKSWVLDGTGASHSSFHCYKDLGKWLALMQQTTDPITLKSP